MAEYINRTLKYILIGLIAAMSCKYIPDNAMNNKSIMMICFIISICYALIDRTLPSINYIENKINTDD